MSCPDTFPVTVVSLARVAPMVLLPSQWVLNLLPLISPHCSHFYCHGHHLTRGWTLKLFEATRVRNGCSSYHSDWSVLERRPGSGRIGRLGRRKHRYDPDRICNRLCLVMSSIFIRLVWNRSKRRSWVEGAVTVGKACGRSERNFEYRQLLPCPC
jgi:hypothetical protein